MATIRHVSASVLTQQTTTSATYIDVPGATITAAQMTSAGILVGDTVAILVTYQGLHITTGAGIINFQHGSTDFDGLGEQDVFDRLSLHRKACRWFDVWDVVGGEDVKVRFGTAGGGTVQIDQISMVIIDLEDLAANDYAFGTLATDGALDVTYLDGATVTFTPTAASNWAVFSWSYIRHSNTTVSASSRISRSGEASSTTPIEQFEAATSTAEFAHTLASVFALTAVSNTFTEQSAELSATTFTRLHSKIFALNLSAFRTHAYTRTDADLAITGTAIATPTEIQTVSITPSVQGDVWVFADFGFDKQDSAREAQFRLQIDNSDDPSGQTTDAYTFSGGGQDATDEDWMTIQTMVTNMTAASHTIDLDAAVDSTTGTPAAQYRLVVGVAMEQAIGTDYVAAVGHQHQGGKMIGRRYV